jgi:hypothetical protein
VRGENRITAETQRKEKAILGGRIAVNMAEIMLQLDYKRLFGFQHFVFILLDERFVLQKTNPSI